MTNDGFEPYETLSTGITDFVGPDPSPHVDLLSSTGAPGTCGWTAGAGANSGGAWKKKRVLEFTW